MSKGLTLLAGGVILFANVQAHAQPLPQDSNRELIEAYCVGCHNFEDYAGSLDLTQALADSVPDHAETWEKVIRKLRAGMMPPPGEARPPESQYQLLMRDLENQVDSFAPVNPGSVTMHRLNRTEYANAIRDIFDLEIDPSLLLPSDTLARGFDNMAGSLVISPTLLEAYSSAATRIASMALGFLKSPTEVTYIPPGDTSQNQHIEGMPFGTRGGMVVHHTFPADGDYTFIIKNHRVGTFIPGEQLEINVDGERMHLFDYTNLGRGRGEGGEGDLSVTVPVKAGSHTVGATFLATHYRPSYSLIKQYDRKSLENEMLPGLYNYPVIGFLRIQGPFNAAKPENSASIRKVYSCRPANSDEERACAREILMKLAKLAYRRPVSEDDMTPLMAFFEQGLGQGTFEEGIELAVARMLASPKFLVRLETQPEELAVGEVYRISDLELASRLSFFLWSSIPDEELIDLAASGKLKEPDILEKQVRRMLADPRASSLVTNFASQWFYLRNLDMTYPDGIYYPDWDDELRQGFRREMELFFESVLHEDRSIIDLLDADFTFVNERLARHYGIPGIYGSHFRRVTLGPELEHRRGLLGKGSFLSVTFTQNFRTSPVKRGVWVLENILGTPPPEPPPNVPPLEDAAGNIPITSLQEQMILHRQDPACASCHRIMDGIGFALENFDADGKWREFSAHPRKWGGVVAPIDANVELWDGTRINGVNELRENLLRYSPQFVRFAVEKLMTFGLGRGVEYSDMPVIRRIVNEAEKEDFRFSSLVLGIVNSEPFQMRVREGGQADTVAKTEIAASPGR
jgi:hypothetical protein